MTPTTRAPNEEWSVSDRWWTDEPVKRYYRAWHDDDGRTSRVEVRDANSSEWRLHSVRPQSHEPPRNSGEGTAVDGPMPLMGESTAGE